jgi:hypothetical protein
MKPLAAISLLIGIPTSRDEFRGRLATSDYLRRYSDTDEDWYRSYGPHVAAPLTDLMARAEALGVRVRRAATLDDLSATAIDTTTVILISHWKGAEWSNDDLMQPIDPARFMERVANHDDELARWIARRLNAPRSSAGPRRNWASRALAWLAALPREDVRALLRQALDVHLHEPSRQIRCLGKMQEHPLTRRTRRRDALDRLFVGLVEPGNRLELFDGMHTMRQIDAALHPGFSGILDLTTCTSTPLADYLAVRRSYQPRLVHFGQDLEPEWLAQLLVLTLEQVAAGEAYLDARAAALGQLAMMVHETRS